MKTLGQAQQVCVLETGELCTLLDLPVTLPGTVNDDQIATKNFLYHATNAGGTAAVWGNVEYINEDVCICYLQTGEFVLSQDHESAGCTNKAASYNYATLLGIREVPYDQCGCC